MVSQAVRANVGCVGALLYYPNDTVQHAGVVTGFGGVAGHGHHAHPRGGLGYFGRLALVQEYSAVTAACLLVRRSIFEEVGGLDESLQVAFNDVDFCLRVRAAGYRNLWTPFAALYHHESASRGTEDTPAKVTRFESEIRFMRERWGDSLDADPAYNPNLSLNTTPFALAFPPRETDGGAPVTVTR
jgi:GT2 family glycosyltransferase